MTWDIVPSTIGARHRPVTFHLPLPTPVAGWSGCHCYSCLCICIVSDTSMIEITYIVGRDLEVVMEWLSKLCIVSVGLLPKVIIEYCRESHVVGFSGHEPE